MGQEKRRSGLSLGDYLFWVVIGIGVWVYFNLEGFAELRPVAVPVGLQGKLQQVAAKVGANPNHLAAVIHFETGGTWDPSISNAAGSGATGLIQFMPETAAELGTSVDELAQMSALDQLDYVEAYLRRYQGNLGSLSDTYMAVLYPQAIGQRSGYVLFQAGTTAYDQNQGLDLNGDRLITKGEAVHRLREAVQ